MKVPPPWSLELTCDYPEPRVLTDFDPDMIIPFVANTFTFKIVYQGVEVFVMRSHPKSDEPQVWFHVIDGENPLVRLLEDANREVKE